MKTIQSDIVIIGGGLTGLAIAYFLRDKNIDIKVVEARDRLGGRIQTLYQEGQAPLEMGATWLGRKHTSLVALLEELDIGIFKQELSERAIFEPISTSPHQVVALPPNDDPSFRIKGGSSSLINALTEQIPAEHIYLNQAIRSIEETEEGLLLQGSSHSFQCQRVVSTLPPNLFVSNIDVKPNLPEAFRSLAQQTHTWMGESIKVALRYAEPFWRKENSSGTIVSNVGPIPEMYDHSNAEDAAYALKGFLNGSYFSLSKAERLAMIMQQLHKYYGKAAEGFVSYEEAIWRKDPLTFVDYPDHVLPHQNNGHPDFRQAFLNGKLFIAGSETAAQFPGYMDGAVRSAQFVCEQVKNRG